MEVGELPGESVEVEESRKETDLKSKELTERMVRVMQKISEYGYLTIREIELIYANQTYAYNVVGTLKDKGLIGEFATTLTPRKAYYLRPKGYRTLEKYGQFRLKRRFLPQHYKPFIFTHRMACARAGLTLEAHKLIRGFLPESLLWERQVSQRQKLCDGEFLYGVAGDNPERVGLEVELTLKNRDKLDESFRQLKGREDLHQVWWLCGDEVTLRAMRAAAARRPWLAPQRHFFCRLEDFLDRRQPQRLADTVGAEVTIDPLAPTLRARKPEPPPAAPPVVESAAPLPPAPILAPPPQEEIAPPSLMRRMLQSCRTWLRGSWSVYRRYDGSRELTFHRWPHVCAAGALTAGLMLYRHAPALVELNVAAPSAPQVAWRKRRPRHYAGSEDRWAVYPLALSSAAGRYRFKARVVNEDSWARGLCGAAVYDTGGRKLVGQSWNRISVGRHEQLEPTLEFQGPRSMDRFFFRLSDCSKAGPGLSFLVQFN